MNRRECLMSLSSVALAAFLAGMLNGIPRAAAQVSPTFDEAHRQLMFSLLANFGKKITVLAQTVEPLGIRNHGQPIPVLRVATDVGRARFVFDRVEIAQGIFLFQVALEKDSPDSEVQIIRVDANLRRVGRGVVWKDNRVIRLMSEAESNTSYEFQATTFIKQLDDP